LPHVRAGTDQRGLYREGKGPRHAGRPRPQLSAPRRIVKAHGSWCRAEGVPDYLGEREPLEDTGNTYGVCPRHMAQVLTAPRPRPLPSGAQLIVVVAEHDRGLFEYLARGLATVEGVQVILYRRQGARGWRRAPGGGAAPAPRRARLLGVSLPRRAGPPPPPRVPPRRTGPVAAPRRGAPPPAAPPSGPRRR